MRKNLAPARARLRDAKGGDYCLEDVLRASIEGVIPRGQSSEDVQVPSGNSLSTDMLKGLWPARLLLDPRLRDDESRTFRRYWMAFFAAFALVQLLVVGCLCGSAYWEWLDTQPLTFPYGTVEVGRLHYESLGEGYCRESGMRRPYGFSGYLVDLRSTSEPRSAPPPWPPPSARAGKSAAEWVKAEWVTALAPDGGSHGKLERKEGFELCGRRCSALRDCNAFALDQDLCYIYTTRDVNVPDGFRGFSERRVGGGGQAADYPSVVVQANGARNVACWSKLSDLGDAVNQHGFYTYVTWCGTVILLVGFSLVEGWPRGP